MTGKELKALREQMRMTCQSLGRELGYQGNANSVRVTIRRYESGHKKIPDYIASKVSQLAIERGLSL